MRQFKISTTITKRDATLEGYLNEINKIPLISIDEEIQLAQRIKEGDRTAVDRLVLANLRFVVSVAKQYQNQGMSLPDLINEGNLGLIKAAEKFDETRGFKFISYAVWWIRQSIMSALAEHSRPVRLPLNQVGALNKVNKAFSELEQELGRTPSNEEVAAKLDVSVEKVDEVTKLVRNVTSLDAPFSSEDDSNTLTDVMPNPDAPSADHQLNNESLQTEIDRVLSSLDEREKDIIEMFFGLNGKTECSLDEIGEKFNLTRERVRQIKEKAIRKLKKSDTTLFLKAFL